MTRLVVVKRIHITTGFDYPAAKAEHDDAKQRGDIVTAEPDAIVIHTRVFIRSTAA